MCNGVTMFAKNPRETSSCKGRYYIGVTTVLCLWLTLVSAWAESVKIEFLPPPMEGTISLGIYNSAGKLVRVLHREDPMGEPESKLTAGDNGLITQWDGNDDSGKPCPPGSYRARGVMVGDLDVDGVDFIGNDWVTEDDSPRFWSIAFIATGTQGDLVMQVVYPWLERSQVHLYKYYKVLVKTGTANIEDSEIQLESVPGLPQSTTFGQWEKPAGAKSVVEGFNATYWRISKNAIQQWDRNGKLIRTLKPQEGDPVPARLAASAANEKLYVLYGDAFREHGNVNLQRLRGYDFTGVKPGAEPKVLFEQDIRACDSYEQIAAELQFPDEKPFVPSPTLTVALIPNLLTNGKPGSLQVQVGVDKTGCYLATADRLPLCHISETKNLRWALMGRPAGSKELTIFDSDGAVVEEFRVSKAENMMAFDAGVISWPGAETPSPAPKPSASASPPTPPASAKPSPALP